MKLYKYTTAEYGLAAIREKRLKVATLSDINDPNEWIPIMRDDETGRDFHVIPEYREKFKSLWIGRWGFISLSRLYNSLLMWGHYADKFRGMVLAFDVLDKSKIIDVRYTCERYELDRRARETPTEDDFENLIVRKDWSWAYEQECRLISNLASCTTKRLPNGGTIYFQSFDPDIFPSQVLKFTGVVLGSECTVTMEDIHQSFNRNPSSKFSVLQLAADSPTYSLVVRDRKAWNGEDWA